MIHRTFLRSAVALVATLFLSAAAHAQLFRAYLASNGFDTNPCTLPAPCRLLPAALAAVASGGEIWMLDSANYNVAQVNITKSVTILAVPGALGSVVGASGNAIEIGTAGVKIALRNLVIVPLPGGGAINGINMIAAAALTVENCLIVKFPQSGIVVDGPASVLMTDSTLRANGDGLLILNGARATVTRSTFSGNAFAGVFLQADTAGTTTTADIADSTLDSNNDGAGAVSSHATAQVKVSLRDSRVIRSSSNGLTVLSIAGAAVVLVASNNIVSNNGNDGIASASAGSRVWASGNTVSDNGRYGLANLGGIFESAADNAVRNNVSGDTDGTVGTIAKM